VPIVTADLPEQMLHLPKPHDLQTKFVFGLILAAFVLGSLFLAGSYFHMRSVLKEEVRDKARLIFAHLDSIQHYVRDVLRPAMYEHFPSSFIIQAMSSSYIARQIMSPDHGVDSGSLFRRVAIDARNPDYEANELEQKLIRQFQETGNGLWQGYQELDGERYYIMAPPVRHAWFRQTARCHRRPRPGGDLGKAQHRLGPPDHPHLFRLFRLRDPPVFFRLERIVQAARGQESQAHQQRVQTSCHR
jgi:hypothetical protein